MQEVRLIDANAAADKIMCYTKIHADELGVSTVAIMTAFARMMQDEIDFPTINPEVRHGRWIHKENYGGAYSVCSECGAMMNLPWYWYCGKCGAQMYGGVEDAGTD